MAAVPYTRQFRAGDRGADVEAVGRALARSRTRGNTSFVAFVLFPKMVRRSWGSRKQHDLRRFKRKHGLKVDALYTKEAHAKLSPFFDAKARKLMGGYHPPPAGAELHWQKLLTAMKALDRSTAGYLYGAGHGQRLTSMEPTDHFDCSSSSSYVLKKGEMFPGEYALVSGDFGGWGVPGRGEYFTVWYSGEHVWIRLEGTRCRWWRFDTSPHSRNDRRSGPRLRLLPRFTFSFTPRHWPGM